MFWTESIDAYCERTDPSFWSEPINALTNLAFLVAAGLAVDAWRRAGGKDWPGLFFALLTGVVGIGSLLFHTFATRWAAVADVVPIAVFIHGYFLLAMRRYLGLGLWIAIAATVAFALASVGIARAVGPWLGSSAGYLPALLALAGVGLSAMGRRPEVGRALVLAAGIFTASLAARMLDLPACEALPFGTHFLWHILNAVLLGHLSITAIRAATTKEP